MTTRRTLLKQSAALGLAGVLPQVVGSSEVDVATTPSAATGRTTTYTMRGFLVIDEGAGPSPWHYRELRFTVNHHEHWRDDTVDVVVENPLRPQDTFDFRVAPWQKLSGVVCEIHDYVSEQERRERADDPTGIMSLRA